VFYCACKVGRVVELRVEALHTAEDVEAYAKAIDRVVSASRERAIICADHRPVGIYSPAVTDALVAMFTTLNSRIERAALIASPTNATFVLQLQRIVREAENSQRRVFLDPHKMVIWLSDVLTRHEIAQVRAHLGVTR